MDYRHGHHHSEGSAGCGPGYRSRHGHGRRWGYGFGGRPNREEWLRRLEEYQKDLEQRTADVADLIRRLKDGADAPALTSLV